jgi:protein-S-isoprenylcysteine O-methyltransferase Ste14
MKTSTAAAGSSLFFACAPAVVAGVIPYALTGWEAWSVPVGVQAVGAVVVAACAAVLLHAFARFVREGVGTPAPVAPTAHLVVGGLYRHVRNPMYVAVVGAVLGQAALFGRPVLLGYGLALLALFVAFVRGYEEPTLRQQFGPEYDAYRAAVPGWWPRARPARPPRGTS